MHLSKYLLPKYFPTGSGNRSKNWILHFLRVLRLGKFEHDCSLKKLYLEARPTGTLN